jgi:adenine-specific DNA-methyltransferase
MAIAKKPAVKKAAAGDSAKGANQPVDAIVHKADERLFIPSREEAGQEEDAIAGAPTVHAVPLNSVTHRGQDPELYWLHKYGSDDQQARLAIDIRSLYRHEHVEPEALIARLYSLKNRDAAQNDLFVNELHGNPLALDELDKPVAYYRRPDKWRNRLIQGDSLLVMTSLLEREGMAGSVQCIYIDPPYGIKYGSNWQMRMNDRNVKDGADEHLSGEGEVIKAFRDTWELGIHSYLSYLRDRLLVAKELLNASGSCFVQISDENVHLVRCLMDEVFGSENFCSLIAFRKTSGAGSLALGTDVLASTCDYLVWYAKDKELAKFRQLYLPKKSAEGEGAYTWLQLLDGQQRKMTAEEREGAHTVPTGARVFRADNLQSQSGVDKTRYPVEFQGRTFVPTKGVWKTSERGMSSLKEKRRLILIGNTLSYVRFFEDFPVQSINNFWEDTVIAGFADPKVYVVQTTAKVIQRCILMTTDPGDLVLDPTCGSGTTAHVAEQWGRRWITSDTSRIALNIAKTRLMTATYPWYRLADTTGEDIRHGFVYKTVPHVTLKSLANDEPPDTETLYDQPEVDKKKLRVAGPFTVETLQSFEPLAPDRIDEANASMDNVQRFTERVFEHLKHAGIKNGLKNETAVFNRVDVINDRSGALHAEGWYDTNMSAVGAEKKAYFHIGPQFGTVSKKAVNDAVKACRQRADADWLVILGFSFESDVDNRNVTLKVGSFEVTKVRMHDDLMQDGLIKKDKKAASFVTIGEPDIAVVGNPSPQPSPQRGEGASVCIEIRGLDLYDPMADEVKPRSAADIAYWMVDDDYDGANFIARQVFFCGGDHDEFDKFKRGLSALAVSTAKAKVERTLKLEIDDEAFERVYGLRSHPIPASKGRRVAVRVISQFGEESTKVVVL